MADIWYYVQGDKSVGPVSKEKMGSLFADGTLKKESYVWRKEFDNWKKVSEVEEFQSVFEVPKPSLPNAPGGKSSVWDVGEEDQVITIKVGHDRGADEAEFGPYTLKQLRRAFQENRINGKTFVFVPGAENWVFLADTPLFGRITNDMPPIIEDGERRMAQRRPFVARLLFHDESKVYEGICRDISVGGLQILVSGFHSKVGETIKMNVHPDNGETCFSATGKVVRVLSGNQGVSLKFEGLDEQSRSLIHKYINT